MKKYFLLLLLSLMSHQVFASDLKCQIAHDNEVVFKNKIALKINQKTLVGKTALVAAYVTEKENQNFILENFLVEYEARFYSQGVLNQKSDQLVSSIWGREHLIDISCGLVE